jgi:hypothetical protein
VVIYTVSPDAVLLYLQILSTGVVLLTAVATGRREDMLKRTNKEAGRQLSHMSAITD